MSINNYIGDWSTGKIFSIFLLLNSCSGNAKREPSPLNNRESQQLSSTLFSEAKKNKSDSTINLADLFPLTDAEKILGEAAHLSDSASAFPSGTLRYSCAYFANARDLKSGKTGSVYFFIEDYGELAAAREKYSFIKTANEDQGIKTLKDLGDEAYFHSDNQNFYFIMVRKDKIVFNMKVNKITNNTSLDEFNPIAKKITEAL